MDLIEYFERQKQRCERDITEQHIQQLREARNEYQRMTEFLKARD